VVAKKVNHSEEVARMKQFLDSVELRDPTSCGVDVEGRRHAVDERCCENEVEDEFGGHPYCEALHHAS
jgi:hypothetical protein